MRKAFQAALVNTYTTQLERLGGLADQVRAALATAPKARGPAHRKAGEGAHARLKIAPHPHGAEQA